MDDLDAAAAAKRAMLERALLCDFIKTGSLAMVAATKIINVPAGRPEIIDGSHRSELGFELGKLNAMISLVLSLDIADREFGQHGMASEQARLQQLIIKVGRAD